MDPFLTARVEAILFVADRPLSQQEIAVRLDDPAVDGELLAEVLALLALRHPATPDRGFALFQLGGRYQLRSTPPVAPLLRRVAGRKPTRLSRAALEVLAIVAFRQPCTRGDVERVRGVECGPVLRSLLEKRLVRVAGRREEPGRPSAYAVTPELLSVLGLGSLDELPNLREFTALGPEDLADLVELGADAGEQQVTFEEYATRQALARVDAAVDERLRRTESAEERPT